MTATLPPQVEHGSGNAYSYYKCRCDVCSRGQGVRAREYRERYAERFRTQRRAAYKKNPLRFKELTKARVAKHKSILSRYKLLKGCIVCGYRASAVALQFHHRNPADKSFTVSVNIGRAWRAVKAEVRKCDVVCANCHAVTHHAKEAA